MTFAPIGLSAAASVRIYRKKEGLEEAFGDFHEPIDFEAQARELVAAIEDEACVAYLEGVILHCKKAINRHARWCMEVGGSAEGPEWWTKYQEEGA